MAVSYLSKVYEANPYVLPVDLNLLARVNAYKQQTFYQNAQKVDSMLGNLQNSDIINQAQREKLLGKVNNLTSQLNNAGGIDYSDVNASNQIQGYVGEIGNDSDIINGIMSTKKIRAFQKNVEKMQTDPKLSKYYNVSNVTRIMKQQIEPYVNGDISARYDGPTAPRPYEGNPVEKLLKNMKNLPPDVEVRVGESGTPSLYKIGTKEELSATDIDAVFDGLIDANTKAQLQDDAWYNFDYATGGKFDKAMGRDLYNNEMLNASRSHQMGLDSVKIQLKSTVDPQGRADLLKRQQELEGALAFSQGEISKGTSEWDKMWDKDPEQAKYGLYVGKIRNAVIKGAGYSKEKVDFKINQEWAFEKKKEAEAFKQGYQLNPDGTWGKLPWADDGLTRDKDGKLRNKKGELVEEEALTAGVMNLTYSQRDGTANDALKVSQEGVEAQVQGYQAENSNIFQDFIQNYAQEKGLEDILGYKLSANTTVGGVAQNYSSDLIGNLKGKNNLLEVEDIHKIVSQAGTFEGSIGVNHEGKKFRITGDQLRVLRSLESAWTNYAEGKIDKIPGSLEGMQKEWIDFAGKYQANQINIDNRRQYLNEVNTKVQQAVASKLSAADRQLLAEYENGSRSRYKQTKFGKELDDNYGLLVDKIGGSKAYKKFKDDAFAAASKTYNYYSAILSSDKDVQAKVKLLVEDLAPEGEKVSVQPTSIQRTDDGKKWQINFNHGKDGVRSKVEIDATTAAQLGVKMLARPELEDIFAFGARETPKLHTYIPSLQRPISYKIQKRAGGDFVPGIIYKDQFIPIKSGTKLGTANDAYELMQKITTGNFKNLEDITDANGNVVPGLLSIIKEHNNKPY